MVNRVREVVLEKVGESHDSHEITTKLVRQRAERRKYMSWNAVSAALAEIIEFLEELVDMTKLLVGANEFRSGLLTGPTYHDYAEFRERRELADPAEAIAESRDEVQVGYTAAGAISQRQGMTLGSVDASGLVQRRRRGTSLRNINDGAELPG